ncbi:MAG: (2Fe-2S)-binding protein [Rhodocyclaceae bacterium]|nr:(2Fe-2S)-binding protein [Rhodocyclaceae bacterium]
MYVCVCKAVTEREVHQAIRGGARSLRDLRSDLGIIEECGRCAGCARQCLRDAEAHASDASHPLHYAPPNLMLSEAV